MITSRRQFLTGLSTLIAAPAIIKVAGIMPVKAVGDVTEYWGVRVSLPTASWRSINTMLDVRPRGILQEITFRGIPIRVVDQLSEKEI